MDFRNRADLVRTHVRVRWMYGSVPINEQVLELPERGITFILGRNGSGKTTLLRGLRALASGEVDQRCEVSLITRAEAGVSQSEWDEYLARSQEALEDERYVSTRLLPQLATLMQWRKNLPYSRPVGGRFSTFTAREVLTAFGFDCTPLAEGFGNTPGSVHGFIPHNFAVNEYEIPKSLAVDTSVQWVFLDMIAACQLERPGDDPDPTMPQTNVSQWIEEEPYRSLLHAAMIEFAGDISLEFAYREVTEGRTVLSFRYLSRCSLDGAMSSLLDALGQEVDALPKTQFGPDDFDTMAHFLFPHDLFSRVVGPDSSTVAGPWIEVFGADIGITSMTEELFTLMETLDVEPTDGVIEGVERELLDRSFEFEMNMEDDSANIVVTGFRELRQRIEEMSAICPQLDVGVAGFRLSVENRIWVHFKSGWSMNTGSQQPLRLPFDVSIDWLDERSRNWMALNAASTGQRRVMGILLKLASQNKSRRMMMIADEFDRALHPTTARALVEYSDQLARRRSDVGFVSTHNVSLASMGLNPNWYCVRGADGSFRVLTDLDDGSVAEFTGSPLADVLRMKRLVVMVEGYHDEMILKKLISDDPYLRQNVLIVAAGGAKNFLGTWSTHLKALNMPVLVVHDKQNPVLEDIILRLKIDGIDPDSFVDEKFEALGRAKDQSLETKAMKRLLAEVAKAGQAHNIHVCGLAVEDVVDCLPPEHFRDVNNWAEAHASADEKGWDGARFKDAHGINNDSIADSLARTETLSHPELLRLLDRICTLLGHEPGEKGQ